MACPFLFYSKGLLFGRKLLPRVDLKSRESNRASSMSSGDSIFFGGRSNRPLWRIYPGGAPCQAQLGYGERRDHFQNAAVAVAQRSPRRVLGARRRLNWCF